MLELLSILIMVSIPSLAYSYGIKARIKAQEKQDSELKLTFEEIQRLLNEVILAKDTDSQTLQLLLQNSNTQSQALAYVVEFIKFNKR